MTKKEQFAKFIRILSVPPVMITALVLILAVFRQQFFHSTFEILMIIFTLGIFPVLAYPLQKILPKYRDQGREGQRNLAFVLNLAGYTAALCWAVIAQSTVQLLLICGTYFVSVLLLVICNKLLHFRASGHACSATGPLIFTVRFIGPVAWIPCILFAVLIAWSSVTLKRHTWKELIGGMLVCFLSLCLSYLFIYFV